MQLLTLASAAALLATASATTSFNLNSTCVESDPKVRIFNRCPYTVYLWSVLQGQGCPSDAGAVLPPGGWYQENFRPAVNGVGTSIKLSKTTQCKGGDIAQVEYYPETSNPGYEYNYIDMSFVDCQGGDCPCRDSFYLKAGNENGLYKANDANEICPILKCTSKDECAQIAYINPDDRQTKSCDLKANMDVYMCTDSPSGGNDYSPEPAPSSSTPSEEPSSVEKPTYTAPGYEVNAAAAPEVTQAPKNPNTKTKVVYVTEYATAVVEVRKRHVHGHRHQNFHA